MASTEMNKKQTTESLRDLVWYNLRSLNDRLINLYKDRTSIRVFQESIHFVSLIFHCLARSRLFAGCLFCVLICRVASGNDAEKRGQEKSHMCQACHGERGLSVSPEWPNIGGQKQLYLKRQLMSFRSGDRANQIMNAISQTLSDDDIEDLAIYYSAQECKP
jgi:cytochrome c553